MDHHVAQEVGGEHHVTADAFALHARGNVHRTAEVVEAVVGIDGNHRTVVHAYFNHQGRINVVLAVEGADLLLDLKRCLYGCFGAGKHRHHGVANRLHQGPLMQRDTVNDKGEMPLHPAVGPGVAEALVEGGRVLQVTEKDSQALHADFLSWGEHLGGKQVAKFLHGGDLQRRRSIGIPFEAL